MTRQTRFIDNGNPWGHPHAADAVCPDGKVRRVRLGADADTVFSWPARGRATAGGPTVPGYVGADSDGTLRFTPYVNRAAYAVTESTPGYMPDGEPAIFTTRGAAQRYAHSLAQGLRGQGYRVTGNMRDGYRGELHPRDLGRVIEIGDTTVTPETYRALREEGL